MQVENALYKFVLLIKSKNKINSYRNIDLVPITCLPSILCSP